MVNSRQKGAKAELQVAYMLKTYTGLDFTQTPGSGSGKIKGDLYVIDKHNSSINTGYPCLPRHSNNTFDVNSLWA